MDSIEFILILASFGFVLFWYVQNLEKGEDGGIGLLALTASPTVSAKPRAYRVKERKTPNRFAAPSRIGSSDSAQPVASYRIKPDTAKMRQRFRRQDEARYRVKDKAAGYRPRSGPTAA